MFHFPAPFPLQHAMITVKRRPQRNAGVRGGGLDENLIVKPGVNDSPVGEDVQSHASGVTKAPGRNPPRRGADQLHHSGFKFGLRREGILRKRLADRVIGFLAAGPPSWRSQLPHPAFFDKLGIDDFAGIVRVGGSFEQMAPDATIVGPAGQTHGLAILQMFKPQELFCHRTIHPADAGPTALGQGSQRVAAAMINGLRLIFRPVSVNHQTGGLIPVRAVKCGGGVAEMVFGKNALDSQRGDFAEEFALGFGGRINRSRKTIFDSGNHDVIRNHEADVFQAQA